MGGIAELLASILGIASQASAENDQKQLGWANLAETKQENNQRQQLATASRTDASGNTVSYDPALQKWTVNLSTRSKGLQDAQDAESLAQLTQDAPRNRADALRKDQTAQMANEQLQQALTNYKYRPQKTEADYIGDATRDALIGNQRGGSEAASAINRSLLRMGNGSNIPAVFKAAADKYASDFGSTLGGAKRQGAQDYVSGEGAKDSLLQHNIAFLQGISDDTPNSPVRFTDLTSGPNNTQAQSLAELLSTLGQGQSARSGATAQLMQALGQSIDFSGLGKGLGDTIAGFNTTNTGAPGVEDMNKAFAAMYGG